MEWRVRLEEDDGATRAYLEGDPDWTAYLLADLDPPFRRHARFYLAARAGRDRAVLLHYAPPEFTALVSLGERAGVAALLAAIERPGRAALGMAADHRDLYLRHYATPAWRRMCRMALATERATPPVTGTTRLLGPADLPAIRGLLGERTDHSFFFTEEMLTDGVYAGIDEGGRLLAMAGTHVLAPSAGVAAIGNVYTTPAARGRGHAGAVTAAVVAGLRARGYGRVVLNVGVDNAAAIGVYERLGFGRVGEFWEADEATARPVD